MWISNRSFFSDYKFPFLSSRSRLTCSKTPQSAEKLTPERP